MKARTALYSGTFDPLTAGHLDVILRAAALVDRLVVAVAAAHHKKTLFSLTERMALVQQSLPAGSSNIEVVSFGGLVVDCCRRVEAATIVRGVRNGTDMDYESQMAQMNRKLAPEIDTVFLLPAPELQCISSTLVREISKLGGDVAALVPQRVFNALQKKNASAQG